jgi:hypothetical protein
MSWFRSRSRLGSYLALFALAIQLTLSFGHVHLDGNVLGVRHAATLSGVSAGTAVATAVIDPAGKETPALADDFCPICALIHLAGTLVLAAAPSLPQLGAFSPSPLEAAPLPFDIAGPHHSPLGARAPPLA